MKVLVVEDQAEMRDLLVDELSRIDARFEIVVAGSAEDAQHELVANAFDLLVCDLRIPPTAASFDADPKHGYAVAASARAVHPGMPMIFLTGNATVRETGEALSVAPTADLFGDSMMPVVRLFEKNRLADFFEHVAYMRDLLLSLDEISVRVVDGVSSLPPMAVRALRIYATRRGAASVDAWVLGGLSGATVLRAAMFDSLGGLICNVFAKIGDQAKISEEMVRYERHVRGVLPIHAFAPEAGQVLFNLRDKSAIFYSVADAYGRSLFDSLEELSVDTLVDLQEALGPWHERHVEHSLVVGEFRRRFLSDEKALEIGADLSFGHAYEQVTVQADIGVQHGDLHCGNVLVDGAGSPLLIDFGDVDTYPTGYDAVVLELSLVFHSDSPFRASGWPTISQARRWWDLDEYLRDCPVPDFVRLCREWALRASRGDVAHIVYAHACRQFKYGDVDRELAAAFAEGAVESGNRPV